MAAQGQEEVDFITELIIFVRDRKFLYDKKDPLYFNNLVKEKAWRDISMRVNKTIDECKSKWKSLRERYGRELKKQNLPSGSGATAGSEWAFAQEMSFLKDCVAPRKTRCNSSMSIEESTSIENLSSVEIGEMDLISPPSKKRKTFESLCQKFEDAIDQFGQEIQSCGEGSDDGDELFLRTILSLLKDVPIAQKDSFKAEIFNKVIELRRAARTVFF